MTPTSPIPPARQTERGGHALAAAGFLLACLILDWPWLSGRVTVPWDAKAHLYPQFVFLSRALHAGDTPFWNPYVFAGHPQIADPQSLIFSPPYLLAAWLIENPGFAVFDAVALAMLALGGLAVMRHGRDLGWRPAACAIAGLAFSFGGSAAWRVQHVGQTMSLAWFAIAFWLLARALSQNSALYGALAGLAAGCMVLGRDQVAWLGVYVLTGYVVWRLTEPHWLTVGARLQRALPPLLAGLACGGALIALPLAWTYALALESNRAIIDFEGAARGSLHPASLLTLVLPNLFGTDGPLSDFWGPPSLIWGPTDLYLARNMGDLYAGALPAVALALLWPRLFSASAARFATLALGLTLLYALGRYTPAFAWLFHLPGADLFRRPADATFLFGALFALAAGHLVNGFSADAESAPRANWLFAAATLALAFLGAAGLAAWKGAPAIAYAHWAQALAFCAAAFAALAAMRRFRRFAAPLAIAFLTLDLAVNNGPNESTALPPAEYEALRPGTDNATVAFLREKLAAGSTPDRRDRVELAAIGFHWPNAGLVHGFEHDLGYNPLRLALFTTATGATDHVALPDQRQFSPLFARYRSPLADMLGLRWIATGVPAAEIDRAFEPGDLDLIARTPEAYIYENPRALPRVVLATQAVAADFAGLLKSGEWPGLDYRRQVLLAPENIPPATGAADSAAKAAIVSYRNGEIIVETEAAQAGWLVLNDVWQAWWFARVDGAPAPVLRANVLFRAVAVPPGKHRVAFTFEPLRGLWRQAWGL